MKKMLAIFLLIPAAMLSAVAQLPAFPGAGICLSGETVSIESDNVIIRHIRFRCGNQTPGEEPKDAISCTRQKAIGNSESAIGSPQSVVCCTDTGGDSISH